MVWIGPQLPSRISRMSLDQMPPLRQIRMDPSKPALIYCLAVGEKVTALT